MKAIKVLDDGFVKLVDHMGSDRAIVQAARISYGDGTKTVSEDRTLIRYLMRHRHTSPFEMCELKFHVRVPMDTWRQWIRHRTANVNEYSTRYSIAIDAMQKTAPGDWRLQSTSNKQGSEDPIGQVKGRGLSTSERWLQAQSREVYQSRIQEGVAREQARKDLPLSTYTEAYWKIDLHNLFHFLSLRLDEHAQFEIRSYAQALSKFVEELFPFSWEAFLDYRLKAISFSRQELLALRKLLEGDDTESVFDPILNARERKEFAQKIQRISNL